MWSEDIDRKIREGADGDIPGYDEKAWDKMLPLLDEHLPVKKKRRWLLPLFIFLLAGGVATVLLFQDGKHQRSDNPRATSTLSSKEGKPSSTNNSSTTGSTNAQSVDKQATTSEEKESTSTSVERPATDATTAIDPVISNPVLSTRVIDARKKSLTPKKKGNSDNKRDPAGKKRMTDQSTLTSVASTDSPTPKQETLSNSGDPNAGQVAVNIPVKDSTSARTDIVAVKKDPIKLDSIAESVNSKKPKTASSKPGRLSIYASLGPDISSIGLQNPGRIKMQYGVGVGFDITKHLTIRSGLYVSRKVYTADSADYHPPKVFWSYFSNLQTIDANCLVYEIPVSLAYRFGETRKHGWFLAAGLSSYLMKKETYDYNYKDSWNQPQSYRRSYNNENNHYFSVLGISGGYQYRVNDRFSLLAEPYMKLPLGGFGFGKVRLSSAGLLFTASYKPFSRK